MGRVTLASLGPLGEELGSGGQGRVFALPRSTGPSLVYKAYTPEALADLDVGVLTDLIRLPSTLPARDRRDLLAAAAWPRDVVVDGSGNVAGFTMALVPERFHTTVKLLTSYQTKLGQTQLLLNPPGYLDRVELSIDDRFRCELLADVAATLRLFHRLGLTVGDLSPNNLLYSRTGAPRCHFIDCDAMRLGGRSVLPQVETTDWEVPAGRGALGSGDSDVYKFALLCVRLFAGDQTTEDPEALGRAGPELSALARRTLSGDIGDRPGLGKWERRLRAAMPSPRHPARAPSTRTAAPVPVWWRCTRARRRGLAKLAVVALILGYGATHTTEIESVVQNVAEAAQAAFADDTAQAQAQADGIAAVLAASAPVRGKVKSAVANLVGCKNLSKSAKDLGTASEARQKSLIAAKALEVTELPDGAIMRAQLISAFEHSRAADDAYRSWGEKLSEQGCRKSVRNGPDREHGDDESAEATKAKKSFVRLWNQIGPGYGHRTVRYQDI